MSWVIGIPVLQTPRVPVQGFIGKPGNGRCVQAGAGSGFTQVCVSWCVARLEQETKVRAYLDAGLGRGFPSCMGHLFLKEKEGGESR